MAKFKVKQQVVAKENGNVGVIKAREINHVGNHTDVKYLVDFGGGIENWKIMTRKELESAEKKGNSNPFDVRVYEVGDGKIVTIAALVEKTSYFTDFDYHTHSGKLLTIGFALYNGNDEFNPIIGEKIAIHRCKHNPFATMISPFSGEFNKETVEAIMAVKAKYIIDNIDNFYRPQK